MTIFIIQLLNSFFYAAVLFLIAAGLSLIYGVMRIVNLAHGTLYALGAYVSAWVVGGAVGHAASGTLGLAGLLLLLPVGAVAIAVVGAVIEPTLLRPLYRRPEEYHLLVTFGLLMILEDAMKFLFGGAVVVPAQAAVLGMGIEALILAFVVVVIGGLGSLEGALAGALIVGLVRTAGIQFFPEIELAVLYLIATAVLLIRPTGLFGRA